MSTITEFSFIRENQFDDVRYKTVCPHTYYSEKELNCLPKPSYEEHHGELCLYFSKSATQSKASAVLVKLPNSKNKMIPFVLSCAHAFISFNYKDNSFENAKLGSYRHQKTLDATSQENFQKKCRLTQFQLYKNYTDYRNGDLFNDIAIASFDTTFVTQSHAEICNIEEASIGDRVYVACYPKDLNGKAHFIEGFIDNIIEKNETEVIFSYYKSSNLTPNSGSPVFYEKADRTWFVIGIHVYNDRRNNINVAMGLTQDKINWLYDYVEKQK